MKYINLAIVLIIVLSCILVGCGDPMPTHVYCYEEILNAESYVDYATEVFFDYEIHPELIDNGMFWMRYDQEVGKVVGVNINDSNSIAELGTSLVDPTKPTVINIHGVQADSYNWKDFFSDIYTANKKVLPPELYGFEDAVDMNKIWLDRGYNVLNYMYTRFADGDLFVNKIAMNKIIEAKVWGIDGPQKMRYRLKDGSFNVTYDKNGNLKKLKYPELEYSIAEYFVGDYLRAISSIEGLTNNEIRIVAHSMGGVVTTAGNFLLTELVKAGQISVSLLPDRLALLDGYLGVPAVGIDVSDIMLSNNDLTIRWTGKKVKEVGTVDAYLNCIKQLVLDFDMPIEYYVDNTGFVVQASCDWFDYVKPYCAVAYYDMDLGMVNYHNAIREMYHASFTVATPPRDITDPNKVGYSISAKSSIEDIKTLRGAVFMLAEGKDSGYALNQAFIRVE